MAVEKTFIGMCKAEISLCVGVLEPMVVIEIEDKNLGMFNNIILDLKTAIEFKNELNKMIKETKIVKDNHSLKVTKS